MEFSSQNPFVRVMPFEEAAVAEQGAEMQEELAKAVRVQRVNRLLLVAILRLLQSELVLSVEA